MRSDRLKAVVSGETTACFDSQAADWKIQFVVDDHDSGWVVYPVSPNQLLNRATRFIHKSLREGQRNPLITQSNLTRKGKFT
jgi:hypothetical protein